MLLAEGMRRGAAARCLCQAFASGAPPHAALLLGEEGIGKRTLMNACAQSLFCTAEEKPCGVCAPCKRFAAGSHPDVHRIARKKSVGVDEVRALIAALQVAPYEGGFRAAIFEDAGAMTVQAQNCLLKTLEEPPAHTVFLLAASSESALLPTVLSRCALVRLSPFTEAEIVQMLQGRGASPERASQVAQLCGGSAGKAFAMLEDGAFWDFYARVTAALCGVRGPQTVLDALNALRDEKGDAALVCDLIENELLEALHRAALSQPLPAGAARLAQALSPAPAASLVALLDGVRALRERLKRNVAWQAALERFLFQFSEERSSWQL